MRGCVALARSQPPVEVGVAARVLQLSEKLPAELSEARQTLDLPTRAKAWQSSAVATAIAAAARGASVESLRLVATAAVGHWAPAASKLPARVAPPKPRATRPIYWERGRTSATPIYERDALAKGQTILGPAIVEGPDTSYAIAPAWRLTIDRYGSFVIGPEAAQT